MKTKLFIHLFILVMPFFFINSLVAQEKTTRLDSLQAGKWLYQLPSDPAYTCEMVFNNDHYTETHRYKKDKIKAIYSFYLSDEADKVFQYGKMGKYKEGKYLITTFKDNTGKDILRVGEILELTKDCLKLRAKDSSILVFKKIEK